MLNSGYGARTMVSGSTFGRAIGGEQDMSDLKSGIVEQTGTARLSEIDEALSELSNWMQRLHMEIGELQAKLSPVVAPVPETTAKSGPEAVRTACSPLGRMISEQTEGARQATTAIRNLRASLAV